MSGKVYLVGAGPGDPELLTLKAARILREADVVLHDDLVSEAILSRVAASAYLINVGKRCGTKSITQAEIHQKMIMFSRQGLIVVRLKAGDPLIFGRAGEEMAALRRAGVEYELVPGVTSALAAAAAAEISLTDRRASSSIVFVSGHQAAGNVPPDWAALAALRATLVIYMPGGSHQSIAEKLRSAGLSGETPCAIVSRATTREEKTYITNLHSLAEAPALPAPTLLIVGDVVGMGHDPAAWNCWLPEIESAKSQTTTA